MVLNGSDWVNLVKANTCDLPCLVLVSVGKIKVINVIKICFVFTLDVICDVCEMNSCYMNILQLIN